MRFDIIAASVAATCLTLAGCDLFTDPDDRMMGIIGSESVDTSSGAGAGALWIDPWDPNVYEPVEAPDTVTAAVPFEVIVSTVGHNSCYRADGAEVSLSATLAEVIPYDRYEGPNCADVVVTVPRMVELVFPSPGDAVVRVTGRIVVYGDSLVDERVGSYDYPIFVR